MYNVAAPDTPQQVHELTLDRGSAHRCPTPEPTAPPRYLGVGAAGAEVRAVSRAPTNGRQSLNPDGPRPKPTPAGGGLEGRHRARPRARARRSRRGASHPGEQLAVGHHGGGLEPAQRGADPRPARRMGYEVYLTRQGAGDGPGGPLPLQFITIDLYRARRAGEGRRRRPLPRDPRQRRHRALDQRGRRPGTAASTRRAPRTSSSRGWCSRR